MRWVLLLPCLAGCPGPEQVQILERWSETFSGEPAPPGLGAEMRIFVALDGTSGEVSSHEQGSGRRIEGPFATFPTTRAPAAAEGDIFLVSTVGRIVRLRIGDGGMVFSAPASPLGVATDMTLAQDGSIRVGSTNGRAFGLAADGTELFDVTLDGPVDAAPAVAPDGTAYFATFSPGAIVGLDAAGSEVMRAPMGESAGAVSFGRDRIGAGDVSSARMFDRSGSELFKHDRQAKVNGTLVLDGGLLAWGDDGVVESLDDAGEVRWTFTAGPPIPNVVPVDGGFGVFATDGTVIFLGGDGTERARLTLPAGPKGRVVVGELGFVYATVERDVVALDFFVE